MSDIITYTVWCGTGDDFPEMLLDQLIKEQAEQLCESYHALHPNESVWIESSNGRT